MAISKAGRDLLRRGQQMELFDRLIEADPTSPHGLEPWDGRNPRDLTRAAESFRLGHEGTSLTAEDARIDEQCRRHQHGW